MRILKENYKEDKSIEKALVGLSNDFSLFSDVYIDRHKNINYVIVGPTGVFVVKSDNDDGKVVCGRIWYRYKTKPVFGWKSYGNRIEEFNIGGVRKEVRHYASELRRIINSKGIEIKWINGVVVFTNPKVNLEIDEPGVPVLRTEGLYDFIRYQKSKRIHPDDLKNIEGIILSIKV